MLDDVVIGEGEFTTEFFTQVSWKDMLGDDMVAKIDDGQPAAAGDDYAPAASSAALPTRPANEAAEMRQALAAAEDAEDAEAAKLAEAELVLDAPDFLEQSKAGAASSRAGMADMANGAQEVEDELEGTVDAYMLRWVDEGALGDGLKPLTVIRLGGLLRAAARGYATSALISSARLSLYTTAARLYTVEVYDRSTGY